ncbi:hypothetical protein, partial [Mesorhizobium sp. M7A.F.Ca.MR.362.00.0.0]|uniref:hypothetical protein n=1 Tax=Mesorhizobium sp. M7A.F.Ca.MR.362.00.0.0 TaxID=2496779 RepID=UPI000FD547BD
MTAYAKVGGIWKPSVAKPWVRVGGVWKQPNKGYVKVAGVWQKFLGGAVVTYIGRLTSVTSASSHTFNGAAIGPAAADRLVVMVVTARSGSSGRLINGATMNATAAVAVCKTNVSPAISIAAGIFSLPITTGTTANLVTNYNGNMSNVAVDVYNINEMSSSTATAAPTAISSASVSP